MNLTCLNCELKIHELNCELKIHGNISSFHYTHRITQLKITSFKYCKVITYIRGMDDILINPH